MLKLAKLNNAPEIFHSIQGEGKSMGRPSVFIRLSLCNLYCIWCDTDYTWNWEGTSFVHNNDKLAGYKKFNRGELVVRLPDEDILDIVTQIRCNNIIITGGEPLVQQKDLQSLLRKLKEYNPGYHIEMETNGTLRPVAELDKWVDQYNVSIKLSNSNVAREDRINHEAIHFFSLSPSASFKFVVDNPDDLNEIIEIVSKYAIAPGSVFLMPQGISEKDLREKQHWLTEICKQFNFNYTDRLHIHIWGSKRGI